MEIKEPTPVVTVSDRLAEARDSGHEGGNRKARRAAMANAKMRVAVGNSGEVRTF